MAYARRTDTTHAPIRDAYRAVGARVLDCSGLGGGWPDMLVISPARVLFVDAKTKRGRTVRITPAQKRVWAVIRSAGIDVETACDVREALALIGIRVR